MPDISKCTNIDCPLKGLCYRYKAKVKNIWQYYTLFEPNKDGKACDYFIKIKDK